MDLLFSIKNFYKKVAELKLNDKELTLNEVEKIADEVYDNNYINIDKYMLLTLSPHNYEELNNLKNDILSVVEREKKDNKDF